MDESYIILYKNIYNKDINFIGITDIFYKNKGRVIKKYYELQKQFILDEDNLHLVLLNIDKVQFQDLIKLLLISLYCSFYYQNENSINYYRLSDLKYFLDCKNHFVYLKNVDIELLRNTAMYFNTDANNLEKTITYNILRDFF